MSWVDRRTLVAGLVLAVPSTAAHAASASTLARRSEAAYRQLCAANAGAKTLGEKAQAVLIFPEIMKAGVLVGGQGGEGAMLARGKVVGYYSISALSYGLQLGAQKYSYALFFMTQKALNELADKKGWSIGSGLSVVFVDEGFAKPMNTTTISKDVYAFAFGQRGLMAGSGLEGAKIRQIQPSS